MFCPICYGKQSVKATLYVVVTHACTKCGQGWKSGSKRKTREIVIDLRAVAGRMRIKTAKCFGGKIVEVKALDEYRPLRGRSVPGEENASLRSSFSSGRETYRQGRVYACK